MEPDHENGSRLLDDDSTNKTRPEQGKAESRDGVTAVQPATKGKRKGLSPRVRFEVFKRDGFRCKWCGVTPHQSVLRVDHVIAVANGGTDDPLNLVTACFDCNAGKSDVPIEKRKLSSSLSPDLAIEHAEQVRAYLAAQREVVEAKGEVVKFVAECWSRHFLGDEMPSGLAQRLASALADFSLEEIDRAVSIVAAHPDLGSDWEPRPATQMGRRKYLLGILRNWREDRERNQASAPTAPTAVQALATEEQHHPPVTWVMLDLLSIGNHARLNAVGIVALASIAAHYDPHSGVVCLDDYDVIDRIAGHCEIFVGDVHGLIDDLVSDGVVRRTEGGHIIPPSELVGNPAQGHWSYWRAVAEREAH